MTEQNITNKPLPELPPVSPEDIDQLLTSGKVENLTSKFDQLLAETISTPTIHPNELMFLDKKKQDKIAALNTEAKKVTAKAKDEVAKVLIEAEEEIPAVTMTDEEMQRLTDKKERINEPAEISLEEKSTLIRNIREQLSQVTKELKKIIEEEKSLTREKYNLQQEMSKAKKVIDRTKIQTRLSRLQGDLVTISRRKKNVQTMQDKYNQELRNLQ